ncbi:MAG: hypothetical protein NTV36_00365, partial [Candidatus Staskawiczbacteria bacterium]|nr:hypothetical protein [Candidatus Staskawiczbacteria bacterium]
MEPKQKLKDSDRVYATGFGPEPKLVKFLKQPVNPKTAGVAFLLTGFCVIAVSAVFVFTLFARPSKFTQTALVKPAQIQVVKTAPIVAGSQQIKWSVLINKKDLQNNEHFLKLPKGAKNIQVTPLSKKQAAAVVAQAPLNKNKCVTCNTTLAVNTIKSKSSGNNFFLGSLVSSLNSFLDYIRQFLFADLEQSASQVIEQIIPPQPEAENPVVTQASDATYVDVTSPAPAESGVSETTQTPPAEPTSSSVIPAEAGIQSESASSEENTNLDSPVPASAEGSGEAKQGNDNVNPVDEIVQVTYDTPAPTITEQTIETGKLVTISNPTETVDSPPLTDVVASTKIPEIYKVGQEDKIKIKWKNNGNQQMTFHAYDKDNNGKLDYVEWTVPHLSDQVFEIIFISKAWELNENKEIVNDIYDQVATQDQI